MFRATQTKSQNIIAPVYIIILAQTTFCFNLGCQKSPSSQLNFEKAEFELGVVRGGSRVRHEFPFLVAGNGEVTINELKRSCQCIVATSDLVGKTLRPGERGIVALDMNVDQYGGDFVGQVNVVTTPPSAEPILLQIHGVAWGYPEFTGVQPIVASVLVGKPFTIDLNLAATRPSNESKYIPDFDRSTLGSFRLKSYESSEPPLRAEGGQVSAGVREIHRIRLEHDPLMTPTSQQEAIQIVWKGVDHPTIATVKIEATHPLSLKTQNPFLGFVKPGETVIRTYEFAQDSKDIPEGISLKLKSEGNASAGVLPDGKGIRIQTTAPASTGRFTDKWLISSAADDITPLEFTVSGIVRE